MAILQSVDLHFIGGGSDKIYCAIIRQVATGCTVEFAYGRRGNALVYGSKTTSPVPIDKAQKIFTKLIDEKTGKGYRNAPGIGGVVFAGSEDADSSAAQISEIKAVDKTPTGVLPQLLNPIENITDYMNNPNWGAQKKYDGKRLLVRFTMETVIGINRKGFAVPVPPDVERCIRLSDVPFVVDGELIGQTLYVFDLLEVWGQDIRNHSYINRYDRLKLLPWKTLAPGLQLSPLAATSDSKRALLGELQAAEAEGIVFKDLFASYVVGRPSSGGSQLKYKFYETASVIVAGINDKRSVSISVYAGDNGDTALIPVGNVTIPPNFAIPKQGAVVEVRYLYAFKGGSLFQPVYLGVRDDIDSSECVEAQLKYTNKADTAA